MMWLSKLRFAGAGIMVVFVLLTAVTVGMNHGFQAHSAADARITPDEYETDVSADESYNNPMIPDVIERPNHAPSPYVERFVETAVGKMMQTASVVSVWTYQNKGWLSPWWAQKVLTGAVLAVFVAYGGFVVHRLKGLLEVAH